MRQNSPPGPEGPDASSRAGPARPAGPRLEERLAEALAGGGRRPAAAAALDAALARIGDAARRRPAPAQTERPTEAARTAQALNSIASWIEAAEGRLGETVRSAAARERDMAAALGEALAALKDRVEGVENRVREARDRTAASSADTLAALGTQLAALERKLETDGTRLSAALGEALLAVRRKVDEIERRVDDDRARREAGLAAIAGRLDGILGRPDPSPALAEIGRDLDVLKTCAGRAAGRDEIAALARSVVDLEGRIAALPRHAAAAPELIAGHLDRLDETVRQVGQALDTAPLEFMLRAIDDKLARGAAAIGPEALDERLEVLRAQVARDVGDPLQGGLAETLSHVRALHGEAAAIAERAAKSALRDASIDGVEALRQGFSELKSLQASAERKAQAAFKSVQSAIEALTARLPDDAAIEPEGAAGPPLDDPRDPASALRLEAAVLRLQRAAQLRTETPEDGAGAARPVPGAAFAAEPPADPGAVRSNLIAAARRAAQARADEASPTAPSGDVKASSPTLIERLRQSFEDHRR